jgi:hypothetical protein
MLLRLRDCRTFQAWPFNQGLTDTFQARAGGLRLAMRKIAFKKTPQDNYQNHISGASARDIDMSLEGEKLAKLPPIRNSG